MTSLAFVAGVIARRLGHSQAAASAIAYTLSEADRELIELATRDPGGTVQIATVIYGARLRAADRLADPECRRQAVARAKAEAADHYRAIKAQGDPPSYADVSLPRRDPVSGIRVVPDPYDLPAGDAD